MDAQLLENAFVLMVLLLSGGFVFRRIARIGGARKRGKSGCGDCASASCAPVAAPQGEKPLPMK